MLYYNTLYLTILFTWCCLLMIQDRPHWFFKIKIIIIMIYYLAIFISIIFYIQFLLYVFFN